MAIFPGAVATDSDLYLAANLKTAVLTDNPLSNVATTINVASTTGFPTVGILLLDSEIVKYTGTTGTSFTGVTRGFDGTSAGSHVVSTQVKLVIAAVHHNVLKDETKSVEQFLSDHLGLTTTVTAAEFQRLSGVTSAIQTQIDSKATDSLVVHLSGTETITGSKTFSAGINSSAQTSNALLIQSSFNAGTLGMAIDNQSNTASSEVRLFMRVAGASAGDVFESFSISGVTSFSQGIDNSDNDRWKLAASSALGSSDRFIMDTSGWCAFGPNATYTANYLGLRTDAAENAAFWARVNNATGDPYIQFTTNSTDVSFGIDNSDSDRIKISFSNALGTSDFMVIDPTSGLTFKGTATNDNATAGWIGEAVRSAQSTPQSSTGTGQFFDVTSISLTAGDWDISGIVNFTLNGATQTVALMAITSTSGNSVTGQIDGDNRTAVRVPVTNNDTSGTIAAYRVTLTATTTFYLKARMDFSAGTPQAFGRISARRMR